MDEIDSRCCSGSVRLVGVVRPVLGFRFVLPIPGFALTNISKYLRSCPVRLRDLLRA